MILASLCISGRCVEIMSFNGSLFTVYSSISTFIAYAKVIMCKYLAAYIHVHLVACALHAYMVGLEA